MLSSMYTRIRSVVSRYVFPVVLGFVLLSVPAQMALAQPATTTPITRRASCQTLANNFNKLSDLLRYIMCFMQRLILPLLILIAIALFIWGIMKFISSESAEDKEQGQQFMIWGIIGFAVMFSVWGLVNIFGQTFRVQNVVPVIPVTPPAIR